MDARFREKLGYLGISGRQLDLVIEFVECSELPFDGAILLLESVNRMSRLRNLASCLIDLPPQRGAVQIAEAQYFLSRHPFGN